MGEGRQYWESPEGPYAEFSGGNPEIQETGPQGAEERFKGQRLSMDRAAPRGPRHSSPQPRELIRVWACLSSAGEEVGRWAAVRWDLGGPRTPPGI